MNSYTRSEFQEIAHQWGCCAKTGDVFLLQGDLGAGKTTFAQAFIHARYPKATVTSPTFSICHDYGDIVHYDLYRLTAVEEVFVLDLQEHFYTKICLVEWPERLGPLTPKMAVHIRIGFGSTKETRTITID